MHRRAFLKGASASVIALGFSPHYVLGQSRSRPVLVSVFQRGAVDGLNMIPPFGEPRYYGLRPTLGIPAPSTERSKESAIDLDGFFGFHPRMEPLHTLYEQGALAVVHAAGSPNPTRSHFEAQDYMESATPGVARTRDGWMNRYLQSLSEGQRTPLEGVSIGRNLPRTLAGRVPTLSLGSLAEAQLRGPVPLYRELLDDGVDDSVTQAAGELFRTLDFLRAKRVSQFRPDQDYPAGQFPSALRELAQLIKADVGLQTACVEISGWDHHVAEGAVRGQLANRLGEFASGLRAFYDDLGDEADVVIVTMSEFGRTAAENGNGGTDHGHGNAMLVLGPSVQGGRVYGRWPGLEPEQLYEGRDLDITTDFRDVLAELVAGHLNAPNLASVFPQFSPQPVGLLS